MSDLISKPDVVAIINAEIERLNNLKDGFLYDPDYHAWRCKAIETLEDMLFQIEKIPVAVRRKNDK